MHVPKKYNRIISLVKRYYIIFAIFSILLFVSLIAGYKLFLQKPTTIYVKVKVNQGLWWAITQKPPFWYTQAIRKGDTSYDFLGKPEVEILDKSSYLSEDTDVYDIYVTLKMKVSKQANTFTYNRSNISIGAPLEVQFPKETLSGTVIALSYLPFSDKLLDKNIYLQKNNGTTWEYNAIQQGDYATDGIHNIFIVEDKNIEYTNQLSIDPNGNMLTQTKNQGIITLRAKVKLKKIRNDYIFGEEKIVKPGRTLNISLSSLSLNGFTVTKIE